MNLATILAAKRREQGITQDELAAHIGVSKSSVSKWEKGQSFPDITHLPLIASYFDITVDQLINHSPKLSNGEIVKIYTELAKDFAVAPFGDVIAQCEALVRRYYPCHQFLLYIVKLYIYHAPMADAEHKSQMLQSAIKLCKHTLKNCRDIYLLQKATQHQAICYMILGESEKVLELLCDESQMPHSFDIPYGISNGAIIGQTYQMQGNAEKANEVMQIELFQSLMLLFGGLLSYLRLNLSNYEIALPIYERAEHLADTFNIRRINSNNSAMLYGLGAHMYQVAGKSENAIDALKKYVDVCIHGFSPFMVRSDSFFQIDHWLADNIANQPLPYNEAVAKEKILNTILLDPVFNSLHGQSEFTNLVQKLKNFM